VATHSRKTRTVADAIGALARSELGPSADAYSYLIAHCDAGRTLGELAKIIALRTGDPRDLMPALARLREDAYLTRQAAE
jgi:hypothetical protein